jgi:antitoxin component of RelBE/YafQ-DinJ toxin-antitoxin module
MSAHKLTLTVDPDVVEAAKRYAAANGTTVSRLVEAFLAALAADRSAPVLARLRGELNGGSLDDHRDHLADKHR